MVILRESPGPPGIPRENQSNRIKERDWQIWNPALDCPDVGLRAHTTSGLPVETAGGGPEWSSTR